MAEPCVASPDLLSFQWILLDFARVHLISFDFATKQPASKSGTPEVMGSEMRSDLQSLE
jgi:hypothetical protein